MLNRKFLSLFRTLDTREVAAFQRYLKRIHGQEDIALAVFGYLRKFHPGLQEEKKLQLAYAYRKIFGSDIAASDYNRDKILNALSDLYLWLREYLLWEKAKSDAIESHFLWLMILQERGLDVEFSKHTSWLRAELKTVPKKSIRDHIRDIAANHFFYYHRVQDSRSPDAAALGQCADDLDLFYATTRLKLACEMANLKNRLALPFDLEALTAILKLAERPSLANDPLLLLYREVYQMLVDNQDERYLRISALLTEHERALDPGELLVILSYLHNYVAAQIRKGKEDFWEQSHQLNKFGIEHGILMHKNLMSTTQFNNIVNVACKVKDFQWADYFITSQSKFLPADIRDDTALLAKATLLFGKNDFQEVLQILEQTDFKDIDGAIRARALILRCYYERQADADQMLDYCAAFDAFLRRHQKTHKEAVAAVLSFLRIVKMLIRRKQDKRRIIHEIEGARYLSFKSWLLGKTAVYKAEFAARKRSK